jgi:hypothetical protein
MSLYIIRIKKLLQSTQSALIVGYACGMPCSRAPEVYNLVHFCFDEKIVSMHSQSIDYIKGEAWQGGHSTMGGPRRR